MCHPTQNLVSGWESEIYQFENRGHPQWSCSCARVTLSSRREYTNMAELAGAAWDVLLTPLEVESKNPWAIWH